MPRQNEIRKIIGEFNTMLSSAMLRHGVIPLLGIFCLLTSTHAAPIKFAHSAQAIPLTSLTNQCIKLNNIKVGNSENDDATECVVMETGVIGNQGPQTLYYALYCLTPGYMSKTSGCAQRRASNSDYYLTDALVIFVQEGQDPQLRPLFEYSNSEIGMFNYGRPEFMDIAGHPVMNIPIQLTGTGAGNDSEYFVHQGQDWRQLDTQSWSNELNAQLPKGKQIRKGIWPNMQRMTAAVPLYQQGDSNCCPTGGAALVELGMKDTRIILKSVKFADTIENESAYIGDLERNFKRISANITPTPTPVPTTKPTINYPSLSYPLTISSWLGNGFGVVAELKGTLLIEGDKAQVHADTLRLRQVTRCEPKCVTIKNIKLELYRDTNASHLVTIASSQALPVNKTFAKTNDILEIGENRFDITLPDKLDLNKHWLGLEIENANGGTYYTHSERNIFARALNTNGKAGDPCENVSGIDAAIKTHCDSVLEIEMNKWYRPIAIWWNKLTDKWHPVNTAIHENNLQALQILLKHEVSVDDTDKDGTTVLMIASANGNNDLVKILLQAGADVNYTIRQDSPQQGRGALTSAIYSGEGAVVETLLSAGAKTTLPDKHGWFPVHYAAYYENLGALHALKLNNANFDINTSAGRGESPLMIAAQYGKTEAIKYLLSIGVNTALQDRHGKNAYDYAEFFHQQGAMSLLGKH